MMRGLAPLLAIQFIGSLGFSVVIPILVFLVIDMGGAIWTYGFVGATYSAFQLIGAPILGSLSDRVGRRGVLFFSQAGTLAAWLLFLWALELPKTELATFAGATLTLPLVMLFCARALDGLTGGNVAVANALVADLTKDDHEARQKAFGRMGMAASVGFSAGPALSGLLTETSWGYAAPIAASAAISGIAMLMCFRLPKPEQKCPEGPPTHKSVTRVLGHEHKRTHDDAASAPHVWQIPVIRRILFATFVIFLAFNIMYAVFPVHAESALDWKPAQLGYFFTIIAIAMIVTEGPILSFLSGRAKPQVLFAGGLVVLAIAFGCYATGIDLYTYVGAVCFAFGNGIAWPTFQARIADAAGDELQGAVQGVASSASSLASIIGLVGGGILYVWAGPYVFLLGGFLFLAVALGTKVWFSDDESEVVGEA